MAALLTASTARPFARTAQVSSASATSFLKPLTPLRPAAIRRSLLVRAEQQTDSKDSYQVSLRCRSIMLIRTTRTAWSRALNPESRRTYARKY